jgi:hypothetical protein
VTDPAATLTATRAEKQPAIPRWPYLLATAVFVAGVGIGGFRLGLSTERHRGGDLRVTGHFTGTVSYVDADGSAFCVTPRGGAQRCSVPFQPATAAPLTVGQNVAIATAELRHGDRAREVFIVLSP